MANEIDALARRYGEMKPSPRNALMGLLSDALQSAQNYASKRDPVMPGGYANPPLNAIANLLGLQSLATTANRLSYGDPLTNARKANVPFLKPETADALMMAPLSPRTAVAALSHGMADGGAMRAATVWHGSPHKFDKFDSSKIGTGEGAQAYGHGLYLAESPDVARQYQSALSSRADTQVGGIPVDSLQISDDAKGFVQSVAAKLNRGKSIDEATGVLQHNIRLGHPNAAAMKEALEAIKSGVSRGSLYKVDLPDEAIAKMLDWDKPLSQQHPDTALALQALQDSAKKTMPNIAEGDPLGRGVYSAYQAHRGGDSAKAAQYLRELGVPGIRYLDGGSRGAGAGTSNFVVFPGNENLLTILERNGKPVR